MNTIRTVAALRRFRKKAAAPVVFVPTMGALHRGHETLLAEARRIAGKKGTVVASIFVNPTQFGPNEDFAKYPRTPASDLAACRRQGADAVFLPTPEEMYAGDASTFVEEIELSRMFCGAVRPGHFRGVATVVAKLFLAVAPDVAVFGEKDWQQLAVVRRMVRDLLFPVEIAGVPTVREPDGLALSSRNRYLTPEERAAAPGIYAALRKTAEKAAKGETSCAKLRAGLRRELEKIPAAQVEYAEIADAETLSLPARLERPARALVAVRFPSARLIDNHEILPPPAR